MVIRSTFFFFFFFFPLLFKIPTPPPPHRPNFFLCTSFFLLEEGGREVGWVSPSSTFFGSYIRTRVNQRGVESPHFPSVVFFFLFYFFIWCLIPELLTAFDLKKIFSFTFFASPFAIIYTRGERYIYMKGIYHWF